MKSPSQIAEYLLDDDDIQNFSKWAFGDNHNEMKAMDIPKIWNALHGELLELNDTGEVIADMIKMIEVWKNET